jgi:hypothetical protein
VHLERIEATGFAHFSYLIANSGAQVMIAASAVISRRYIDIHLFNGSFETLQAAGKPVKGV